MYDAGYGNGLNRRRETHDRTMTALADEECVPCQGGVDPLDGEELDELADELDNDWEVIDQHHLEKQYSFPDFKTALAFVNKIGDEAERQGHHPDIELSWGSVTVTLYTHKIDGMHRTDFVMAAKIDRIHEQDQPV